MLMLVQSNSDAPLAYGLYVLHADHRPGAAPGAALGVIAVVIVAVCMFLSHWSSSAATRHAGLDP